MVYALSLKMGYDVFHLCRAEGVLLPGGLPVFIRNLFAASRTFVSRRWGFEPGRRLGSATR
jgi:hypothetical protein